MPPDPLARVRRAARKAAHAHQERDEAIRAAVEAGHSLRAVADAAGLTNPRVHQIVRKP